MMIIHKDIIARLIFSFVFFAITFRVLVPVLFNFFKERFLGQKTKKNDIDAMIRSQKERLRSQYGLSGNQDIDFQKSNKQENDTTSPKVNLSKEIKIIQTQSAWGGGSFVKEIQTEIAKTYSYTIAESKINALILLCDKRRYLNFLTHENQSNINNLKNFYISILIFHLILDEVSENKFFIIEKISKKMDITAIDFAIAFQIKIIKNIPSQKSLKEDMLFSQKLILHQFSEENLKNATELILKNEANLWSKSATQIFEELTFAIYCASLISPLPLLKDKNDILTAGKIIGISPDESAENIKKTYKKIALKLHPDIITGQNLPKTLEKIAIHKFNKIQEAYEIIIKYKKI